MDLNEKTEVVIQATELQRFVDWVVKQPAGIVIALILAGLQQYQIYNLRADLKELQIYQRTKMETQLDRNTTVLDKVESFLVGQKSR